MADFPPRPDGCPIPYPPGSIDGTASGTIRYPVTYPEDLSLTELSGNDYLDGQIVIQLEHTSCQYGLTPAVLLSRLQTTHPGSDWTMSLLMSRLNVGVGAGRFCLNANGTYVINPNMAYVNVYNTKFQGLTSAVQRVPICQTTVTGTANGAYRGNEACSFR